jgi:hypothetical protein
VPKLVPTLAAATAGAVGLYMHAMGAFEPLDGCLPTGAVASAAPSPTCASDLRECLRQSADLRQTTFGGRYVTAEDVARCMEVFNACIHGGASGGGNQAPPSNSAGGGGASTSTPNNVSTSGPSPQGSDSPDTSSSASAGGGGGGELPTRFKINSDLVTQDCLTSGDNVTCKLSWNPLPDGFDSWTAEFTGLRTGLTVKGTLSGTQTEHAIATPSCRSVETFSGPATYTFSMDGTVTISEGPFQRQTTGCPSTFSRTTPGAELTAKWG